jgi:F0F1-type ATP synthase alpha subunit
MSEQSFEYRIQHLLTIHGFLVINCARSKPFDLIAIKNQIAVPLELKGKYTVYKEEQKIFQKDLANRTRTNFLVIKQGKKRGEIIIEECYAFYDNPEANLIWYKIKQEIVDALHKKNFK